MANDETCPLSPEPEQASLVHGVCQALVNYTAQVVMPYDRVSLVE